MQWPIILVVDPPYMLFVAWVDNMFEMVINRNSNMWWNWRKIMEANFMWGTKSLETSATYV
jgi:hypothetical protein